MTEIWVDAQLSPSLAAWINRSYEDIRAKSVGAVGLRDAEDEEIFGAAREAGVVVMSKDSDFLDLLEQHGPPPQVIWVTCGNTSNRRMREVLSQLLVPAVEMLNGGEALVVPTDVTDDAQIEEMIETTVEEFGRLDVLVNNAGVMLLEPLAEADPANLQQMVEVNLLGLMKATHAALPVMLEQGSGHIVNISSVAGREASQTASGYNATKFGVNGFSEAVRKEVTDEGIRVTVVEPGYVETELQEHIPSEMVKERAAEMAEQMEVLQSEDIARAVRYAVAQPQHVSVNELLIRPTDQPAVVRDLPCHPPGGNPQQRALSAQNAVGAEQRLPVMRQNMRV